MKKRRQGFKKAYKCKLLSMFNRILSEVYKVIHLQKKSKAALIFSGKKYYKFIYESIAWFSHTLQR